MENNQNQNLFEGLPGLEDTQGIENILNAQSQPTPSTEGIPAAVIPNQPVQSPAQGEVPPVADIATLTKSYQDSLAKIAELEQKFAAQFAQAPVQQTTAPKAQAPGTVAYTPEQLNAINTLLSRGVPLDRITSYLNSKQPNVGNESQAMQEINALKAQIAQKEHAEAEQAFIGKMYDFGDKFGLSEKDLETLALKAYNEYGVNVAHVKDLEPIFRMIYPEQYNLRIARMQNAPTSQIFGGSQILETTQKAAVQAENAFVEQFLQGKMPNQYYKK